MTDRQLAILLRQFGERLRVEVDTVAEGLPPECGVEVPPAQLKIAFLGLGGGGGTPAPVVSYPLLDGLYRLAEELAEDVESLSREEE